MIEYKSSEILELERDYIKNYSSIEYSPRIPIQDEELLRCYGEAIHLLKKKEQGRLLELPFAVGSDVYTIEEEKFGSRIYILQSTKICSVAQVINIMFSDKEYFHTREEAEKYLQEMRCMKEIV